MTATPNRFRLSAAVALVALCASAAVRAEPVVGQPAPEFAAIDSNGQTQQLKAYRGKTVVLEWTNHDCPYVRKHYSTGNMQTLQKDAAGKGIVWLSVISSAPGTQGYVEPAEANMLSQKRDATPSAVLLDAKGDVGRLYEARTTPQMFVIDAGGTLQYMGAIDDKPTSRHSSVQDARNYVRAALDALADGRPADPSVTRPYGCSVKYGS